MTGREAIIKAASDAAIHTEDAERIAASICAMGYVCVPKEPTELMVRHAWADALAEDSRMVWARMIEGNEDPAKALENLK